MATGSTAAAVDDWKDVPASSGDDWKDVPAPAHIQDKSTIGPTPKTNWGGSAPLADFLHKKLAPMFNSGTADTVLNAALPTQHAEVPKTKENPEGMIYAQPVLPKPALAAGRATTLPAEAFDTTAAERAITPSPIMGKAAPANPIRRVPGDIPRESVGQSAMPVPRPVPSTGPVQLAGNQGAMTPTPKALPAAPPPTMSEIISRSTGAKPLEPNVPLREQPDIGYKRGSRVATDVGQEFGPAMTAPGKVAKAVTEEPARQMGAPPLQPNVSLREQIKPSVNQEAPMSAQASLEQKYPDKAIRQMVHANGEEMVQAAGKDPAIMKAVHDLTNLDVRQAMINSGEDMGQTVIGNKKAMGGGSMTRQEAFNKLLAKGHSPIEIVQLAKKPLE